jgi:hypothetical protein
MTGGALAGLEHPLPLAGVDGGYGGTAAVMGYDSETSSSPMCMHFTLVTSSSLSLTSFAIYLDSLILEREGSAFLRNKWKDKELTNWCGGTGSLRRQRRR